MKVGYYQFRPLFGKIRHNTNKVVNALQDVKADLIVLPELAFTGYYFQNKNELKSLAEDPAKSSTVEALVKLCRKNYFHLVTGFAEKSRDKIFNSALLIGPDGIEHTYRKLHLFNEEKKYFDAGDIPLQVNTVKEVKVGMLVCFDWVFPEAMRSLTLQGAEVIAHPSNLVLTFCQEAMITRCLENRVFAITTNRFGTDKRPHGELKFTGKSQIVAPGGVLVQRAVSQREALFITEIDPAESHQKNITPMNDLIEDRRPEYYQNLIN
ncbi:MAG: acyltransferase [Gammaproteobacteria bacterium]|nr:MAG: acyltransferase [Gammaproteobacteria bacterium]RKZ71084.1 MAG: acyltransferase [Gammaproteobacteria bacterium]